MARRSPWAKQNRSTIKSTQKKYESIPVKSGHKDPMEFIIRENTSLSEKINFLLQHPNETALVIKEEARRLNLPNASKIKTSDLSSIMKVLEPDNLMASFFVSEVGLKLLQKSSSAQSRIFTRQYSKYLAERKIPHNKEVLAVALKEFLSVQQPKNWVSGKFSAKEFESIYLKTFKEFRMFNLTKNTHNNLVISEAFKGVRLTGNQKRAIRRWLDRNFDTYKELIELKVRRVGELKKVNGQNGYVVTDEKMQMIGKEIFQKIILDVREEFKEFLVRKPVLNSNNLKKRSSSTKIGTREERLASYKKASSEEKDSSVRKKEIRVAETTSRISGSKFDATKHCLSVLKREDPQIEKNFSSLINNKELNTTIFVKIFTSGTLAQRRFLEAALSKSFRDQFGVEGINAVGNLISAIGPKVIKNEAAINSTRHKDAHNIFRFLVKKGILDTNHRNGKFVMLMR